MKQIVFEVASEILLEQQLMKNKIIIEMSDIKQISHPFIHLCSFSYPILRCFNFLLFSWLRLTSILLRVKTKPSFVYTFFIIVLQYTLYWKCRNFDYHTSFSHLLCFIFISNLVSVWMLFLTLEEPSTNMLFTNSHTLTKGSSSVVPSLKFLN